MLRKQFQDARRLLRTLGVKAGVGIEPASQTELIDASENVLGVLCAGVPGAGGIDALYVMVLSPNARQRVELIWSNWKGSGEINVVCPLQLHSSGNADNGVRLEELKW